MVALAARLASHHFGALAILIPLQLPFRAACNRSLPPSRSPRHALLLRLRGVSSAKEFGDRLRDKGAKRREALERSTSAHLVRSVSARAEATVKDNVDIVRRPSQQLGSHFDGSFKGALSSRHHLRTFLAGCELVSLPVLSLIVLRLFSCCCSLTQAWSKRAADRELPRGWRRRRSPRILVLSALLSVI